jgi:multisubunit Na+/H+ antiporter MnhC subunit
MVLTGIVVAVAATALALALVRRLHVLQAESPAESQAESQAVLPTQSVTADETQDA